MIAKPLLLLMAGDTDSSEELAARLMATCRLRLMVSEPADLGRIPADVNRGGFASARAMAEMLEWDQVKAVIDASGPFDTETPPLVADACQQKGVPRLRLMRPGWPGIADAERAPSLEEAARSVPLMGRAFLAVRPQDCDAFEVRRDIWYMLRIHRPLVSRFPLRRGDFALGAPPFTEAHERQLLVDYRIDTVIAQDTGLDESLPLIAVARTLGLGVQIVTRPAPPRGPVAETLTDAMDWAMKRL